VAIDRASAEPYYLQLGRHLTQQIADGRYAEGDRLPSESELCRRFDLSRSTVRETLRQLENNGRIKLVHRRGAFVTAERHPGWMLQFAGGFSDSEAAHENRQIDTRLLSLRRQVLPDDVCDALHLAKGTGGVLLERLRWVEGRLALFARNYLPAELASILGDGRQLGGSGSLNRCLRAAGWVERGARRSLSAVAATPDLARHLEVVEGAPLMLVQSVMWNADGQPFDYYTSWLNTDIVDISIQVEVATGEARGQRRT